MSVAAASAPLTLPVRTYDGYAFDLDGTVYLGESALPGAIEGVQLLRAAEKRIVFVTNKVLGDDHEYAAKLSGLGLPTREVEIVTAAHALIVYLQLHHPRAVVLAIAEESLQQRLRDAQIQLTIDPSQANVVVASFDRTFDYAKLNAAYRAVRLHGAALIATNPDPFCPTPDGGLPDCAAMLAAIEASTGIRAEAVTGKPSPYMAGAVLDRLGLPAREVAMVGDRLTTDVAMANAAGMVGVLVLSDAITSADLLRSPFQPKYIIDNLTQLIPN